MDVDQIFQFVVEKATVYVPKVLLALVTLVVGFYLVRKLVKIVDKALKLKNVDESLAGFLESLLAIALKVLIIVTVAKMVGVDTTSFIALIGAAGLAVGLSLQGSLSNFAGGVLILLFKPFKVGDKIEAEGHIGKVQKINIISTIVSTADGKTIVIPNGTLSNGTIINYNMTANRRVDLVFGIGYEDDIEKAKQVLKGIIAADERILKEPEPVIAVGALGASSVDIFCKVWVQNADYLKVFYDMQEKVKLAYDKEGISFPYPQMDLHMLSNN